MAEEKQETTKKENKTVKPEEKIEQKPEEKVEVEESTKQEKKCKCETVAKEEYLKLKYQFAEFMNNFKEYEKEFENYKRRTKEEIKAAEDKGVEKAIRAVFPALDSFKKAKMIVTDKSSLSGINLIEKNLMAELERLGVKKIDCKGKKFDTEFHNAVALVEDKNVESGFIVDEVETGYTLNDKVIKYSQVVVSK